MQESACRTYASCRFTIVTIDGKTLILGYKPLYF